MAGLESQIQHNTRQKQGGNNLLYMYTGTPALDIVYVKVAVCEICGV